MTEIEAAQVWTISDWWESVEWRRYRPEITLNCFNTLTATGVYRRPSVCMLHTRRPSKDVPYTTPLAYKPACCSSCITPLFSVWEHSTVLWCPLAMT